MSTLLRLSVCVTWNRNRLLKTDEEEQESYVRSEGSPRLSREVLTGTGRDAGVDTVKEDLVTRSVGPQGTRVMGPQGTRGVQVQRPGDVHDEEEGSRQE